MVSLNQQHIRAGMARSHSSVTIAPSRKIAAASSMTASDPDLAKQLYKANVKVALDDRISATSSKYDDLCAKFTSPNSSAIELCQYLAALSHFVTYASSCVAGSNFQTIGGPPVYVSCEGNSLVELVGISTCITTSVYPISGCISYGSDDFSPADAQTASYRISRRNALS